MRTEKLRGDKVQIDYANKVVYKTIRKPDGNKFSLADLVIDLLRKGYTAIVKIGTNEVQVTKDTPHLFKEQVPSKFVGMGPWYRYWYTYDVNVSNQRRFF